MACKRCGKCCIKLGAELPLDPDILRWEEEGRADILATTDGMDTGWLKADRLALRCPWLRKIRNKDQYKCRIQDTKPLVCAEYPHGKKCIREEEESKPRGLLICPVCGREYSSRFVENNCPKCLYLQEQGI